MKKFYIALTVVGAAIVVITAILGWGVAPGLIDQTIEDNVQLDPSLETWDKWKEADVPIEFKFYIFNVTNPIEVELGIEEPNYEEVGPYTYREKRRKDIWQNETDYTVQYKQFIDYIFDKKLSNTYFNRKDDLVSFINVPLFSVIVPMYALFSRIVDEAFAVKEVNRLVSQFLIGENSMRKMVPIEEYTFKGFDVSVYDELGLPLPDEFSGGRFGFYKGKNGSTDGLYEIFTGKNSSRFGQLFKFENKKTLGFWEKDTECDLVRGSDGSVFPPFVNEDDEMYIFSSDICMSLRLTYKSDVKYEGINGKMFTPPKETLQGPISNPENRCYCLKSDVEQCPKDGVIDLSACRSGAPILLSTPYFLDGDFHYNNVTGLPFAIRDLHETQINLEPNTGVLLEAKKRIQINFELKTIPGITVMENITDMIVPLFWIEEHAYLGEDSVEDLKATLNPIKIINITRIVLLCTGCAAFIVGGILLYYTKRNTSKNI